MNYHKIKRYLPIAVLLLILATFFYFDLGRFLSIPALEQNYLQLQKLVAQYPILSVFAIGTVYTLAVAVSAPVGLILSLLTGFLLGPWIGVPTVIISATLGATILFLAAKTALGEGLRAKAGPWLDKLIEGFQKDAFSYLLFLRLVPAFPFFIVNVVPALLGMRLVPYVVATLIGIAPGSFVYVLLGTSLGRIIEQQGDIQTLIRSNPEITISLIGLAVLALLPVVVKKLKSIRDAKQNNPASK